MTARKGKYIPHGVYTSMEDTFKRMVDYNSFSEIDSSDQLTDFNNLDISDKNMTCADCIKSLWNDMARKTKLLKELHALVKAVSKKKMDKGSKEFGVCKSFITSLTEYFFSRFGLGNSLFGKECIFTQQKEKSELTQCFGPMFIDFDDYPHYSGKESKKFEKDINEAIICVHGYVSSSNYKKLQMGR